jgi:hypothetical protein
MFHDLIQIVLVVAAVLAARTLIGGGTDWFFRITGMSVFDPPPVSPLSSVLDRPKPEPHGFPVILLDKNRRDRKPPSPVLPL